MHFYCHNKNEKCRILKKQILTKTHLRILEVVESPRAVPRWRRFFIYSFILFGLVKQQPCPYCHHNIFITSTFIIILINFLMTNTNNWWRLQVQGLTSSNPRSSLTTIEQAPLQVFKQEDHLNDSNGPDRMRTFGYHCFKTNPDFGVIFHSHLILFPCADPDPVGRQHHLEVWHHSLGEADRAQASCVAGNDCSY